MFTGPVGPVEVFFLLARNCFWEFLLAWGHRFTLSVEPCYFNDISLTRTLFCYLYSLAVFKSVIGQDDTSLGDLQA